MTSQAVAIKAFQAARKEAENHKPGLLFRVPGFPGIFSDGVEWVVDVNDRAQDWRVKGKDRLVKARWPK